MTWLNMMNFTGTSFDPLKVNNTSNCMKLKTKMLKLDVSPEDIKNIDFKPKKCKDDDELVGFALSEMAAAQAHLGSWDKAFSMWNDALQIQVATYGKQHYLVAETLRRRGIAYKTIGENVMAIRDLDQSVHQQKNSSLTGFADNNARDRLSNTMIELGHAQQRSLQYIDAMKHFQAALILKEQGLGQTHVEVADIHLLIGHAFRQRGRFNQAKRACKMALAIYCSAGFPVRHPNRVRAERCGKDRNTIARHFWDAALVADYGTV